MLRRNRRLHSPNVLDRNSLLAFKFSSIDAVLKDLKVFSRLLHTLSSSQRNESHILERLYYKSKNQHHSALFWRHVCEMRKFAKRLEEFNVAGVLDSLRVTFFRGADPNNAKSMSGSWTQYPDEKYVSDVTSSLAAFSSLAQKMHEKLSTTYRSFSLAMQTGAFIQLILTLTAIASRMAILVSELDNTAQKIKQVLVRLLSVLRVGLEQSQVASGFTKRFQNDQIPVSEKKHSSTPLPPASQQSMSLEMPVVAPVRTVLQDVPIVVERKQKPERTKPDVKPDGSIKKKRKKRKDEIDDIFGF
ncbi:hypothetical protein D9758_002231 [Tetrapyrgos nigripes]|uniref:Nucleolus and neural progenitor protein-like N-terminal domain-containing protein n=1 Tax=Tetrapyrgos nigripes TaxID=182062 RepID=A0A8H5GNW3_9AGAR|nr:hypothetical protein D9758_002231 [Tetrapyrgos nigripes]